MHGKSEKQRMVKQLILMKIDSEISLEKIKGSKLLYNNKNLFFIAAFLLVFIRILSYAWASDDAYHAYTMSANLLAGNGFTPTPGIRVNVSTCPLWTIAVTLGMALWNNAYAVGMFLNLLFSGIALFMLFKFIYKKDDWLIILSAVTAVLCTSKTYLSYTTSGLENAQILMLSSFYLTVLFKNEYFSKKELFKIALLEGLIAFTRMDCALIFALTSAYVFLFRYKKDEKDPGKFSLNKLFQVIPIALAGLSPFILWELFSWFYYASFVPNTALAKLNTGFPLSEYLLRGVWYIIATVNDLVEIYDPFVLFVPILFVVLAVRKIVRDNQSDVKESCVALGIVFYFFYLVYIGGDFMKGRHFLSLFWISLISLATKNTFGKVFCAKKYLTIVTCVFLLLFFVGLLSEAPCWYCDEQKFYYPCTGLRRVVANYVKTGELTVVNFKGKKYKGMEWFYGNKLFYEYRLYDPLLSRLPAVHEKNWRVGHMNRKIPDGYEKTLNTGINHIKEEDLAFYYDKLKFILSGDLFDLERLKETMKFNSGTYDQYLHRYIENHDLVNPDKL